MIQNEELTIIAGPCSVNEKNIEEIYQIAEIKVQNRSGKNIRAIAGTRVVGLKSRTALSDNALEIGMDFPVYKSNLGKLLKGKPLGSFEQPQSALISEKIIKKTNLLIATEIVSPLIQLPPLEKVIPKSKLLAWNPAVNQLGWPLLEMGKIAKSSNWAIGIKNGKWVGENAVEADKGSFKGQTTMEKTWIGLTKYIEANNVVLIHRGVDVPEKGLYRNLPVHTIAKRAKLATGAKLYFDPSHSHGPKMREEIVPATIEAMKLKADKNSYLYDGILVEAGTSQTDTEQHISLNELELLASELAKYRNPVSPDN